MKKFIVIDYTLNISWFNETEEEVIEALGYDSDEETFEEVLGKVSGEYEVIEISEKGELRWLLENNDEEED
jgi:hypothetical protein